MKPVVSRVEFGAARAALYSLRVMPVRAPMTRETQVGLNRSLESSSSNACFSISIDDGVVRFRSLRPVSSGKGAEEELAEGEEAILAREPLPSSAQATENGCDIQREIRGR